MPVKQCCVCVTSKRKTEAREVGQINLAQTARQNRLTDEKEDSGEASGAGGKNNKKQKEVTSTFRQRATAIAAEEELIIMHDSAVYCGISRCFPERRRRFTKAASFFFLRLHFEMLASYVGRCFTSLAFLLPFACKKPHFPSMRSCFKDQHGRKPTWRFVTIRNVSTNKRALPSSPRRYCIMLSNL